MISYTIPAILLASIMMLGGLAAASVNAQNAFEISTEQSDQQATITIKLATNNTVVIPPNGTVIEIPGNITQVDNDTVIIAPTNETITTTPGNVTVIDPPAPEPCGCPSATENATTGEGGPLQPVIVQPAPGQEVITENGTELVANETQEEPITVPEPEPEPPATATNDTSTGEGGNETATQLPVFPDEEEEQQDNSTALAPAALSQMLPWWQA